MGRNEILEATKYVYDMYLGLRKKSGNCEILISEEEEKENEKRAAGQKGTD